MSSRRKHVFLLARRSGAGPQELPIVNAILPPGHAAEWSHHVRLAEFGKIPAELRVAETQDGYQDLYSLWEGAVSLKAYLQQQRPQPGRQEVGHA